EMFPNLRGHVDAVFKTPEEAALDECDVVFFATPHGVAMQQARELIDHGIKVIDLAADFRLQETAVFEQWYKHKHACPDVLTEAVYGVVAMPRAPIRQSRVVGNPGCCPVTVLLGLAPLLQQDRPLIDTSNIIADCKSGVSGAGRKASIGTLFAEASDNFKAYGVGGHRHHPEIIEQLRGMNQRQEVGLTVTPHLVPMIRGMFSTLYLRILPDALDTDFQALFQERYADEPFVDVLPAGTWPETRSVRASNMLRIGLQRGTQKDILIVMVAQDNLVKGAAGQAVQNMNLMFGLDERLGLQQIAVLP